MEPAQAESNLRKHRVSFVEAQPFFLVMTWQSLFPSRPFDRMNERCITIGWSNRRRLLKWSHMPTRGNVSVLVSARELTRREQKAYEEENN